VATNSTQVGLFYSTATGRLRWFLVPDDDSELSAPIANAGESLLVVTRAQLTAAGGPDGLQALIDAHTGSSPSGDMFAALDTAGTVVAVHYLDAACGDVAHPGTTLVKLRQRADDQ